MNDKKELLVIKEWLLKIKEIFVKFVFIIEFLIIGIFMTSFYKFIITKAYEGYYSKVYLIICGITGGLALGIIIYAILKDKYKIEKIFLAIAIPIGMAYLIFLIPTYAPDENAHIYRSYEISEGILFTKTNEKNLIKSNIPSFFVENNHKTLNKYNKLNEEVKKDTNYENKVEVDNPAYSYFPTLYFPNTIMFLIGRIFNINGIIVLYLARIVNFIIFLICGYYAIKIMPFGKILLMTYLLIPMSVHQAISLSADSITNSTILLFIAYTLNLYYKEKINKKNKILYIALAALVSVQKIVYFPIVLISIILIKVKEMTKNEKIKFIITTIVAGLVVGVLWILLEPKGEATEDIYAIQNNINSVEQIKFILTHPISYIKVLCNTIDVNIENYYLWFMGFSLGWMDIGVKRIWLDIYFIMLLFSPFLEKNDKELKIGDKLVFIGTFLIIFVLTLTALYVGHSGVGTDIVKGIQGRYFMPVVILLLLCMCGKERYIKLKNVKLIYPILIVFFNANIVGAIINFFK